VIAIRPGRLCVTCEGRMQCDALRSQWASTVTLLGSISPRSRLSPRVESDCPFWDAFIAVPFLAVVAVQPWDDTSSVPEQVSACLSSADGMAAVKSSNRPANGRFTAAGIDSETLAR